jgi:hypothetical protein
MEQNGTEVVHSRTSWRKKGCNYPVYKVGKQKHAKKVIID